MSASHEVGVTQLAEQIHLRLRRYLEAQYHIRDSGLIDERRLALDEPGGISQQPFVEITPSYAVRPSFDDLRAPKVVTDLLSELMSWRPGIGVFPPYKHQADAIERFFSRGGDGDDLIVATGTGSGKTETFLYGILGMMALEGSERPDSFQRPGVRALLLYPMNALVSDQTARLRRLLGDKRLASLFTDRWGRHPLFGMYTSRTPYPGVRSGAKDQRHLETLFSYYSSLESAQSGFDHTLVEELRRRGRWPAKDIVRFFAQDLEDKIIIKSGKRAGKEQIRHHWSERFLTQDGDRELLTRHEMQIVAPDLLVTNYSMLEYMLLRPIERPLFQQTRDWLASDPRNQFILILDEAHMYRGVGGAEVGLLIRRLFSRLGIGRDRARCILTSASLGSRQEDEAEGREFARALTGESAKRSFALVRGTTEARKGARPGTVQEAIALGRVGVSAMATARIAPEAAQKSLNQIAVDLNWPVPPSIATEELAARQYTCRVLTGLGPLELMIERCSANAIPFSDLSQELFPEASAEEAERATDGLLALGSFARRTESGREEQPLLPTRVHLLFRGLPPLYVCVNPECTERRSTNLAPGVAGRLFTEARTHCTCGARVYELLTHRDCGAAYIRAFSVSPSGQFLWHERGGVLTEFGQPLHEIHLLLEEPHPKEVARNAVAPVILDIATGRTLALTSGSATGARICYRPTDPSNADPAISTFSVCPVCTRRTMTGGQLKIMDLATKGEQPFANLIREQFVLQVASKPASETHPNEGRKALLFSDGRQKAARLARDLPREVERDSFREALVLAVDRLSRLSPPIEAVLDERLYAAFVSVCADFYLHFFDGRDQGTLFEDCGRFRRDYGSDLGLALDSEWKPLPTTRYRQALLRQLADPYYSLVAACAAVVCARRNRISLLRQRLGTLLPPDQIVDVANAWLREMFEKSAFDPALSEDSRKDEFPYFQPVRAADGLKRFFDDLQFRTGLDAHGLTALRDALFEVLTRESLVGEDAGRLVTADSAMIRLALDDIWLQCAACGHLQLAAFFGSCANCGDPRMEARAPDHPYMVARKGFFREPLLGVLRGDRPVHITAEEHTAQLSQRDTGSVYATTEQFELRFQDVLLASDKPPIDVLSCTTTMEVGIDIGSLTAVGLRTVPPQRENYQQRAGRAGRRGTSVSSVITFAQGGAHDAHYFANPGTMISGRPRPPRIKSDNARLARRHIHSHLLQTFFHSQIDGLSSSEQAQLAQTNLMSAFGEALEFFTGVGPFSYGAFVEWLESNVLVPASPVIDEITSWLPAEVAPGSDPVLERRRFVREVAEGLQRRLDDLNAEFSTSAPQDGSPQPSAEVDEDPDRSLLETLFDRGILPSYAFPTDLCSFVIQKWAEHGQVAVAERPQLGKMQALSEYAPGRLLVVNKKTYRVGGVFAGAPPTSSPATEMFDAPLRRYVGCQRCSFVRIESANTTSPTMEGAPCPVCRSPLSAKEFLDPPGFSAEQGRALPEGDRDQEITYASSAQLPELAEHESFQWRDGAGLNLRHAYGEDVLLVVANKGKDSHGFSVCESCGAAWLDGEETSGGHSRPFLLPHYIRQRENAPSRCAGEIRRGLYLGHEFRTDLLLLRLSFHAPMDFSPDQQWLYDTLATLAEAVALGASLHLDIDPGELSSGFRLLPRLANEIGAAEIFLFDTASGGAGYAADAGANIAAVLETVDRVLRDCPANCERSCTKCLRHYGNRFLHDRLDRRLGRAMLQYMRAGVLPTIPSPADQAEVLRPLRRLLSLEGWTLAETSSDIPLAGTNTDGRSVVIGTHPALLDAKDATANHELKAIDNQTRIVLPDYVVERDLPSAYQIVLGLKRPARNDGHAGRAMPPVGTSPIEVRARDLRRLAATEVGGGTSVRLLVDVPLESPVFAVRVPTAALAAAGFAAGIWLVLRAVSKTDDADAWQVLLRSRGSFLATNDSWTIARLKVLGATGDLQLSYGAATGKAFRPQRVAAADVTVVATVVCPALEAP